MPIYHDDFGARVVHLGSGDVVIALGGTTPGDEHQDEVVFLPMEQNFPVGAYAKEFAPELEGKTSADVLVPIRLVFDSVESLDVLIDQAQVLRTRFVARAEQSAPTPPPAKEGE